MVLKFKDYYLPILDRHFTIRCSSKFSSITVNRIKEWWEQNKIEMGSWTDRKLAKEFGDVIGYECQVILRSIGPNPDIVQFETYHTSTKTHMIVTVTPSDIVILSMR